MKIMKCHKMNEHTAFPVFYDVDPSEVRKQTGSVGEALATHTNKNELEVRKWREALNEAAGLSGLDVRKTANGHEAKVVEMIVDWVSLELRPFDMSVDENLIGMEQRMQDLDPYLKIGLKDVRMIGIKGMGGAGKTTLARAIFDQISFDFEGVSFVENVREKASKLGLEKLQQQVLRDVLKNKGIKVNGVNEGKNMMRTRLSCKQVLVVLDDVDRGDQLEMLAGDPTWFKPGSRIIITTRDGEVLHEHNVKWIHDVNLLLKEEAIHLFSRHAFGKDVPTQGYEKHSGEVVSYAAGLPLTIKVLGSKLCGKDDRQWMYTLERLKTIPLKETLEKLELSYESLEDEHKEIFLDVACFLCGWRNEDAKRMLDSCGYYGEHGLRVLEQKSLITLKGTDKIQMHDHLVEMGKNIVRREHADEPNKHTRLWVQEEIEHVMADSSGSEATRCIDMEITPDICLEGLANMKKLRCLIVNHKKYDFSHDYVKIDEAGMYFPNSLQYLSWYKYPHWCLPKTFEANNLVSLQISNSKINQLWKGGKVMKKLRFLDLSDTKLRCLDLGRTPKLERLSLNKCYDLAKLYVHGGCQKSLVYLNLGWCSKLKSISFIERLESLEVVYLYYLDMWKLPDHIFTGHSNNSLRTIDLTGNYIVEIPSSIGNLHNLVSLYLDGCICLKSLPGSICSLQHLITLSLNDTSIEELPDDIGRLGCLKYLKLCYLQVKHVPGSICLLKRLETLIIWCDSLEKLPEDIGELDSLEKLDLRFCSNLREIPNSICMLKHLRKLELEGCKRLEKLPEELGNLECLQSLTVKETSITNLPRSISLLKGLEIDKPELKDHILDDDFIQFCSNYVSQMHGFQQLKILDLRRSGIEEVPEALGQLECLEELDLSCTNVRRMPETICMLKNLKKLFLESCVYLEKLPDDVGHLESLEVLNLSSCYSVIDIPKSICMLDHMKILDLQRCVGIEELSEAIGQLECLVELHLSATDIKHLPDTICKLKHLQKLILKECVYLEKLPDDVGQLESLEVLDLSSCYSIKEIPNNICMLKQLKLLVLSRCFCLEKVPDDVGQLESLEELDLSRCYNIREIPSSIFMLKHLKLLNLESCRMLEKLSDQQADLECLHLPYTWDAGTSHITHGFDNEKLDEDVNSWHRPFRRDTDMAHLKYLSLEKLREDVSQLESLVEFYLSMSSSIDRYSWEYIRMCERNVELMRRPGEVGDLGSLQLLDIRDTYIRHPPQSIYLLKFLKLYGFTPKLHETD